MRIEDIKDNLTVTSIEDKTKEKCLEWFAYIYKTSEHASKEK